MKDYKKYYIITATPEEVYNALTNPLAIKIWTNEEAEMSTVPGSEFSLWDESIVGKNLEFEENKKIVHILHNSLHPKNFTTRKARATSARKIKANHKSQFNI